MNTTRFSLILALIFALAPLLHAASYTQRDALLELKKPRFVPIAEKAAPEDTRLPISNIRDWLDQYPETGITFVEYMSSNPARPRSGRSTIYLAPMGDFSDIKSLQKTAEFLTAFFMVPVRVANPVELRTKPDARRGFRYDADEMILTLRASMPKDGLMMVGVTRHDLFSGRLNGVFGIGYSDLRTCVVSTRRIWSGARKASANFELFRLCKLIAHELGHAFGLPHCAAYHCRMNSTSGVRSIDESPLSFCGPCERKLQWNIGYDPHKRAELLYRTVARLEWREAQQELSPKLARLRLEKARPDRERYLTPDRRRQLADTSALIMAARDEDD